MRQMRKPPPRDAYDEYSDNREKSDLIHKNILYMAYAIPDLTMTSVSANGLPRPAEYLL